MFFRSAQNADAADNLVQAPSWPEPMAGEAFYGIAGETVRTIEPHSEADPVALLIQYLTVFGNIVGRGPHWRAEKSRHGLNLFLVLVGSTSKARKGTSWGHVRELSRIADPEWCKYRIQTGLSSGEGLIYAVRDPIGDDDGASDKRLLIIDEEFASTLKVLGRSGNTLSPILRLAWDGAELQLLTKQSPCRASDPHVSLVAHITTDELRRELRTTELANGFANRFLWACVRRSKALPDGGHLEDAEVEGLAGRLKEAVEYARSLGDSELRRDPCATEIWHSIYPDLSEGKPGLFGAVTSRAEAQLMRIACIYALLDLSPEVRAEHLLAAQAVWNYCEASARFIFGDALGDPLADELLSMLRQNANGLTRTAISEAFGRNRSQVEIARALGGLAEHGLARHRRTAKGQGRPAELWQALLS